MPAPVRGSADVVKSRSRRVLGAVPMKHSSLAGPWVIG